MRTRLRLGAAAAIALGALLLATVLASPALAWHSNVSAEAMCLEDGQIQVDYTVTAWEEGHEAYVKVAYDLNGETTELESGKFDEEHSEFSDSFVLPEGTTGTVVVIAKAFWKDDQTPSKNESKPVELPEKCEDHGSTTTSKSTTTTTMASTTTESSVAPSTSIEETTTTAAVGAATSTTAGAGQLPFTGASSGPMLLAGIVLVGGGTLFLLLSRARGGQATK